MSTQIDEFFWLNKLSESRFFTSKKDVELLRYLIRSTREGKTLKETIIAIDFFGKDASFDPGSDSIVRSNIYNLRKKLESYYLDEGAHDKIRFVIPKGRYQVKIDVLESGKQKQQAIEPSKDTNRLKILLLFSTVALLIFMFLYFKSYPKAKKFRNQNISPVWNYYLQSESPVLIVLGDYFMMQRTEFPDSSSSFIRNPDINNQTDFFNYLEKHPEQRKNLKKLGQSYFGEETPRCIFQILSIFLAVDKPVDVKYSSELSLSDIRENNLIFLGDFGTMNILKPFFEKTGYRYSNSSQIIYKLNGQNDTSDYFLLDNPGNSVFQNDYAIVASVSSYTGKRILFLTSFLSFGKSEALYKLQESNFMLKLSDSIPSLPSDWSLLMKVSGLQSCGFDYEVLKYLY